jgi:hypothetical protein
MTVFHVIVNVTNLVHNNMSTFTVYLTVADGMTWYEYANKNFKYIISLSKQRYFTLVNYILK